MLKVAQTVQDSSYQFRLDRSGWGVGSREWGVGESGIIDLDSIVPSNRKRYQVGIGSGESGVGSRGM